MTQAAASRSETVSSMTCLSDGEGSDPVELGFALVEEGVQAFLGVGGALGERGGEGFGPQAVGAGNRGQSRNWPDGS